MWFLHVRACGACGEPPGVDRADRVCVVASLASGSPLVCVLVGVRSGMGDDRKNALLSEIYVLALSEPPLRRVSSEKDAQSCPEKASQVWSEAGILGWAKHKKSSIFDACA